MAHRTVAPILGQAMPVHPGPSTPAYREESSFSVRIELSAEFGPEYEGEDDAYTWLERWRTHVKPRLLKAVFAELRAEPGFTALPVSRGKHPDDEVEIAVRFSGQKKDGRG
jgi:hypothetical protein